MKQTIIINAPYGLEASLVANIARAVDDWATDRDYYARIMGAVDAVELVVEDAAEAAKKEARQ